MADPVSRVLSGPFLMVQVGDYGGDLYDEMALPRGLVDLARERERAGEPTYPKSPRLKRPGYRVPTDLDGILMLKADEAKLNGFAYWAQSLTTLVKPKACVNGTPSELCHASARAKGLPVAFVTKRSTTPPKGSPRGRTFERWTPEGYRKEPPTGDINLDLVYTEVGKATLVLKTLRPATRRRWIDLNDFHVHFTEASEKAGASSRYPYRSSLYGTCSIVAPGTPDQRAGITPLRAESAQRCVVATGRLHPHVCGRVRA